MSLEGARTALRAEKEHRLWSPWLIRIGRTLSPGMLKLMTTFSLPHKHSHGKNAHHKANCDAEKSTQS